MTHYMHILHIQSHFFLDVTMSLTLRTFLSTTLRIKNTNSRNNPRASAKAAMTSSKKYWYHVRSSAAERMCGAPLCLITYSVQNTACSSGVIGWSR
jgi:hypothetical protein